MVLPKNGQLNIMNEQFVYYLAYGSNLSLQRFLHYIKGGEYKITGNYHRGCKDKNLYFDQNKPIKYVLNDYRLIFASQSLSWDGGGVAFIEEKENDKVWCRLYKVSLNQFIEIQEQEGATRNWYGRIIDEATLGYIHELPIRTITCQKFINVFNSPSKKYLDVIKSGLSETGFGKDEIDAYLKTLKLI
jgi:hypothetical protein